MADVQIVPPPVPTLTNSPLLPVIPDSDITGDTLGLLGDPSMVSVDLPRNIGPVTDDSATPLQLNCSQAERAAGLFLLTLKEKYKLSQKAINFAVGSISTIVDSVTESIQDSVESALENGASIADVAECFQHDDPFESLQTEYKQSKFYREEFGLVVSVSIYCLSSYLMVQFMQEPVTVELGTAYHYKRSGTKRSLVEKCDTFQYVPLIANLQWLLQNRDICQEVSLYSLSASWRSITCCNPFCCRFLRNVPPITRSICTTSVMATPIRNIHCLALMTVHCN